MIRTSMPDFGVGKEKPSVDSYGKEFKYAPGDEVYLTVSGTKEGPYKIEAVKGGKYSLCDTGGTTVKGGQTFEEGDLELYDVFG